MVMLWLLKALILTEICVTKDGKSHKLSLSPEASSSRAKTLKHQQLDTSASVKGLCVYILMGLQEIVSQTETNPDII